MWRAENPEAYLGRVVESGHCVAYVRACSGAPHTSLWRRGVKISHDVLPYLPGLVIATFDPDGTYGNHTDGRSHAAVLVSIDANGGLVVLDQWKGQPVHQRVIRRKAGQGPAVNDADCYHAVAAA
jgi:hypothetical protein